MNSTIHDFLETLFEGAYVVDSDRKIIYWNKASEQITGYKKEEVVGSYCYDNILNHVDENGRHLCSDGCPLQHSIKSGDQANANVYLHHKKGHRVPIQVKTYPLYNENGTIDSCIEVFTDISSQSALYKENRALKTALYLDELTQVNNRKFIMYQLEQFISQTRLFHFNFYVLFIDIDHFKNVNDTYGHLAGDEVLKMVAKTLQMNVRESDYVGRYGGEEFVVLIKNVDNDEILSICEKLRMLVQSSSTFFDDQLIKVTISIGGSLFRKVDSLDSIIERADKNMYEAKQTGRNKFIIK